MSNAERQQRFRERRQQEHETLRREVDRLRARIHELEDAQRGALRLTKATTAQEVVDALAGQLSDIKLAQTWVLIGEKLKAGPARPSPRPHPEPPERRQEKRRARYLYPSTRQ